MCVTPMLVNVLGVTELTETGVRAVGDVACFVADGREKIEATLTVDGVLAVNGVLRVTEEDEVGFVGTFMQSGRFAGVHKVTVEW